MSGTHLSDNVLADQLAQGLETLGMDLPGQCIEQLLAYLALMERWNRVYNLTAVRKPAQMVVRHLLDSLAVVPYLDETPLLDVGTGPGLPGIPIAITRPDKNILLLDSNSKKIRFVNQVLIDLGIYNATAIQTRAEQHQSETGFGEIISRAFASLTDFVTGSGHLCSAEGRLLAMKGIYPEQELDELPAPWALEESIRLEVPKLGEERHLLILKSKPSAN